MTSSKVDAASRWLKSQTSTPGKHATLSPSSAHRWVKCPGSVALSKRVKRKPAGDAAAKGTFLHAVSEYCLRQVIDGADETLQPVELLGCTDGTFVLDTDGLAYVSKYVNLVLDTWGGVGDIALEVSLDLYPVTGEKARGTADCIIYNGGTLYVIDLKTGRVPVSSEDNMQLQIYAAAAYFAFIKGELFK